MGRFVRWLLVGITGLVVLAVALFLATRGDYPVARLVTQDPSLPSREIAGVRLHMEVHDGPPGAPVAIVLHGGPGGDFRSLRALSRLSDAVTVVFYDQRGAGLSERVAADRLSLDDHVAELGAVIDAVSPDRPPILIGHSWGAMLASAYLGAHPRGAVAAVLIEPGYLDAAGRAAWTERSREYLSGPPYWREALLTGFRARHVDGPDAAAAEDFLIGHMVGTFAGHPDNPYHCGGGYAAPATRVGATSSAVWARAEDAQVDRVGADAGRFAGPVLFLAGRCNDWTGPALQRAHAARFRLATVVAVEEAGHDVVWDNPDATLAILRRFLDGLP